MLGHILFLSMSKNSNLKVFGTLKKNVNLGKSFKKNISLNFDILNFQKIEKLIKKIKPDYVINCIGVVKKVIKLSSSKNFLTINSFLPLFLSYICIKYNLKVFHISTDCVFDGSKGNYKENDFRDAKDEYGISKILGENILTNTMIIRTSIIGHEMGNAKKGLLEWFLASKNKVNGYSKAFFSGLTTNELSLILENIILKNKFKDGLYHVAGKKISKYNLLLLLKNIYSKKIIIKKSEKLKIDRSLDDSNFRSNFKLKKKNWKVLINEMKEFYYKNISIYEK